MIISLMFSELHYLAVGFNQDFCLLLQKYYMSYRYQNAEKFKYF